MCEFNLKSSSLQNVGCVFVVFFVVFLAIFVVDTKLIFRYDFVAPLTSEYEKAIIIDRKKSTNDK